MAGARRLLATVKSFWPVGTAAGTTVIFAGGIANNNVDILDVSTGQWTTANLSSQRTNIGAAAAGTKIVFAGGYDKLLDDVDNVDIYDVTTKLWSTTTLSAPRGVINAAAAGTKLIFAGGWHGGYSKIVDIYDVASGAWTASALNTGHNYSCTVSSGNMALFAGGYTPDGQNNAVSLPYFNVDVYNATTGTWGSTPLPTANPRVVGAAAGSQVLFAYCPGTYETPDSVEMYHLQ
jgi:Kelch motif